MDWADIVTAISTGVMAFAVIAGVLVAWSQLHNMKRASCSQAYSSITSDLHTLDALLITNPNFDQLLAQPLDNVPPTDPNKIRQKWLVFWYLDLFENVHFQKDKGIIPKKLWPGWEEEIKQTCNRPGFKKQYCNLKMKYNEDFRKFMESLSG